MARVNTTTTVLAMKSSNGAFGGIRDGWEGLSSENDSEDSDGVMQSGSFLVWVW